MTNRRYGGFWRRSVAYFIDQIILYFITLILAVIGLLGLGVNGDRINTMLASGDVSGGISAVGLVYFGASLLAGATYFTWFHGMGGRTPGKMLLGLRVIQASGEPMTPGIAFLRWVGYLISGLVFCLGFFWVAFDGRKQGWHDKIAVTVVIRDRGNMDQGARENSGDQGRGITTPALVSDASPSFNEPASVIFHPDEQAGERFTDDPESRK
jgi:uncharacterized RDD family membrane protein YckC